MFAGDWMPSFFAFLYASKASMMWAITADAALEIRKKKRIIDLPVNTNMVYNKKKKPY